MSQLVLDEHIDRQLVLLPIRQWIPAQPIQDLCGNQLLHDERVPEILLTLRQPTFVTIDQDFWHRHWCHPSYCILFFPMRSREQQCIPDLLRALLHRPEFRTRAARMGKLARIRPTIIEFWQYPPRRLHSIAWQGAARRKR